jgi:hypothetical protein
MSQPPVFNEAKAEQRQPRSGFSFQYIFAAPHFLWPKFGFSHGHPRVAFAVYRFFILVGPFLTMSWLAEATTDNSRVTNEIEQQNSICLCRNGHPILEMMDWLRIVF